MRTLNCADYFTLARDYQIKQSGLTGNYCCMVLHLEGELQLDALQARLQAFKSIFPESVAKLAKKKKYYIWQRNIASQMQNFYQYSTGDSNDEHFIHNTIQEIANPKQDETLLPLTFHLIEDKYRKVLVIRWFRPLSDAKGIELVVNLLAKDLPLVKARVSEMRSEDSVNKILFRMNILKKCKALFNITIFLKKLKTTRLIKPHNLTEKSTHIKQYNLIFDENKTKNILNSAVKNIGVTDVTLYYVACCMRALSSMSVAERGEGVCIPYSVNLRKKRISYPILGNQLSFFFPYCTHKTIASREKLFDYLKIQNRDLVNSEIDKKFIALMSLGTKLPLEKYSSLLRGKHTGRALSSLWFANIGQVDLADVNFFGCEITDLDYSTTMPNHPGITILFNQFRQKLTVSIGFLENKFDSDWIRKFSNYLEEELLSS